MENVDKHINHIVDWIKTYFANNGSGCKAIIGISGGKDSTIAAALCVRALGKDRVVGVKMPNGTMDKDADKIISILGIQYYDVDISNMLKSFYEELAVSYLDDSTIENQIVTNTPSRLRMAILYAIAAIEHGRVCRTCNASEEYVGWFTKFGDGAGDFAPLLRYTVTELLEIGDALTGIPNDLIHKTPDDGMCGASDEEKFGFTYDELDRYIRKKEVPAANKLEKIVKMHKASAHKVLNDLSTCPYYRDNNYCF